MSEYTERIVLCDNCFPDYLPSFTFFRLENIQGVFRGTFEEAQAEGWQERDYGHACPECVKVELEQEADEGEVVRGGIALQPLFQAMDGDQTPENP